MQTDSPSEDEGDEKSNSSKGSPAKKKGNFARKKKSPMQIKTEYLSKLFSSNMQGDTVHARQMQTPFPKLVKKLTRNHFANRNGSQADPSSYLSFSTDAEKFDPTGAANLM